MTDIRIVRLADVLVNYSLDVKKGDSVAISGESLGAPLIKEIYKVALKKGAFVDVYTSIPGIKPLFLKNASIEQLKHVSPKEKALLERYNKVMFVMADYNTKEMSSVPGENLKNWMLGRKKIKEAFYKRVEKNKNDTWCLTLFPTEALAQEADMNLEEYENFVYSSCLCDKPNPVNKWKAISKEQDKIVKKLEKFKELHIKGKDTDIKASVKGRKWINCDGKMNFPDGEVFTGPVETSVNGHIRFSFPGIYMGKEIENIYLEFKNGKVVKAKADKGEDMLHQLLSADEGAKYVGELAIGTSKGIKKFTKNILFDEKLGGTIHMAVGSAYRETGSKNESTLHWDMICDMKQGGEILADNKLIYKNGKFV